MRIVVVGAQTYLGFHLAKALYEAGFEVTAADFFDGGLPDSKHFTSFFANKVNVLPLKAVSDIAALKPDGIINLRQYKLGNCGDSKVKDEANFAKAHQIFEDLLNVVLAQKTRFFVNVEAAESIYGKGAIVPFDERALSVQPDLWGASQVFFENYLGAWTRALKKKGVLSSKPGTPNFFTFACLRMSEVFGTTLEKGQPLPGFLGNLCSTMLSGKMPELADKGSQSRDLLYVDDAVAAITACLKKLEDTQIDDVFNVGSGVELRDVELVQALLRDFHEVGSDPDSKPEVQGTLKLSSPTPSSGEGPEKLARFCLECTKFRAYFGWRPRHDIFRSLKTSVEESFGAV